MTLPDLTGKMGRSWGGEFTMKIGSSKSDDAADRTPQGRTVSDIIPSVGDWFTWDGGTFEVEKVGISKYYTLEAGGGIPIAIKAHPVY